jgi:hypothetical protein
MAQLCHDKKVMGKRKREKEKERGETTSWAKKVTPIGGV